MTNSEFRQLVAVSTNADKCENLTMDFYYATQSGYERKTGLTSIYEYVKREKNGWNRRKDDIPKKLEASKNYFNNLLLEIEKFAGQYLETNDYDFKRQWNTVASLANTNQELYSDKFSEVDYLIDLYEKYPNAVDGAHSFFMTRGNQKMNLSNVNHDTFIGYLLAYEFDLQDATDIQQRRNSEKISLGKIRADYEKYIGEAESHIQNLTNKTSENYSEHLSKLDKLESKKEELFDQWFGTARNNFKTFDEDSHKKIEELEKTYQEKLQLEAPAQYWENRAISLRKNGHWWTGAFAATLFLIVGSLYFLLWLTPDGMFADLFKGEPYAIKWAVIYVTFLSFFAYGLKIFAKLAMSSFHLSRDAEERQQLTYVYLALNKGGNVDDKDRALILQSLFSRAETGLLKDDSTPTFPGQGTSLLNKINGGG